MFSLHVSIQAEMAFDQYCTVQVAGTVQIRCITVNQLFDYSTRSIRRFETLLRRPHHHRRNNPKSCVGEYPLRFRQVEAQPHLIAVSKMIGHNRDAFPTAPCDVSLPRELPPTLALTITRLHTTISPVRNTPPAQLCRSLLVREVKSQPPRIQLVRAFELLPVCTTAEPLSPWSSCTVLI